MRSVTVRVGTRTDPASDRPTIQGITAASPTEPPDRERTTDRHDDTIVSIRDRMQRALDDGDLPPDADLDLLARHLMTMSNGIAIQAGHGVHADQLHAIADLACGRGQPPEPPVRHQDPRHRGHDPAGAA